MSQPQARWSLAALRTSRGAASREALRAKLMGESREDAATAKLPPLPDVKGGRLPPLPAGGKAKVVRPAATTRPVVSPAEAEALEALREESLVRAAEAAEAAEARAEAAAGEAYLAQLLANDDGDALLGWFARKARKAKEQAESARADAYLARANKVKAKEKKAAVDPVEAVIRAAAAAVGAPVAAAPSVPAASPASAAPASFVDRLPSELRPAAEALRASLDALSPEKREGMLAARDWGVRHLVRRLTEG